MHNQLWYIKHNMTIIILVIIPTIKHRTKQINNYIIRTCNWGLNKLREIIIKVRIDKVSVVKLEIILI